MIQREVPVVVVLSDDLTGAVAAASESARAGASTEVVSWDRLPEASKAQALVIDTNSRLLGSAEAADRVRTVAIAAMRTFGPSPVMYKRLDSLLRGNTFAEIEAWQQEVRRPIIMAAAAPSYAVTTVDGCQHVGGELMTLDANGPDGTPMHPRQLLAAELISLQTLRKDDFTSRLSAAILEGRNVTVDSESLSDLSRVAVGVRAIQRTGRNVGLAGSYGLLGAWFEVALTRTRPGALVVATSYRAATRRQIEVIAESLDTLVLDATRNEDEIVFTEAVAGLNSGKNVALITTQEGAPAVEPRQDVALHTAAIAARVLAEVTPTGLVLLGGEVSSALMRLLAPTGLSVAAEPWPATPIMRLHGGRHDGLLAVIQSGSQGDATRTLHAMEVLAAVDDGRLARPTGGK